MLKLNGKPLDLSAKSEVTQNFKRFLDKAPTDEVFTQEHLVKIGKFSTSMFYKAKNMLPGYSLAVGKYRYWGNPKAIAELKRQTA